MTLFERTIPILRSFDEAKAGAFYVDFLGFGIDWEHRFERGLPLYMQISRAELTLHVSERHGDATPGAAVFVETTGLRALHAEITAKRYKFLRPGLREAPWNAWLMELIDPPSATRSGSASASRTARRFRKAPARGAAGAGAPISRYSGSGRSSSVRRGAGSR